MGIVIILRKTAQINRFRDIMITCLDSGVGDAAVICSGFFDEAFAKTTPYYVSQERQLATIIANRKIALTTIGIHNAYWKPSYKRFRDSLQKAGVNVNARITWQFHWHAKVFLLKKDSVPILGIVGSSNMTRNAFSDTEPFNYEADVYLWDERLNSVMATAIKDIDNPEEIIQVSYDPKKNSGLSIPERLQRLNDEIFKHPYKELEK